LVAAQGRGGKRLAVGGWFWGVLVGN
jgi:hypothetical protein